MDSGHQLIIIIFLPNQTCQVVTNGIIAHIRETVRCGRLRTVLPIKGLPGSWAGGHDAIIIIAGGLAGVCHRCLEYLA